MYIIISIIIVLGLIRLFAQNTIISKKTFVIIASLLLILIASLRSINFGTDVLGYVTKYNLLMLEDISIYWNLLISGEGKDPFFYLFSKFISLLGFNYQVWLAILSGVFVYFIAKLILQYSPEPYISFVILISLGYFYFSLTGLRQTMALALIIFSYNYLKDRKLIKFILSVIVAALFHSSALIFLIAYPLFNLKIGFKQILVVIASFILAVFFEDRIRELILLLSWTEQLSEYADRNVSLSISGFLIQLSILIFCSLFKKKVIDSDSKNVGLYNLLFIGVVFQSFATVVAEFFRVSMFFSIFSIILVPIAINTIKDKNIKIIVYLATLSLFISYILWSNNFNSFKFFWQEVQ